MTTNTDTEAPTSNDGGPQYRTRSRRDPDENRATAVHGARAALYGALAGTFVYPTEESVEDLTARETLAAIETAAGRLGYPAVGTNLVDALRSVSTADLRTAHDALFGIPGEGGTYPVVPYEANYTVRDDIGQQQRRIAAVSGLLDGLGIQRGEDFDERRDHVAVELEAMQVLAGQHVLALERDRTEALENVRGAETTLLEEHLVDFVPPLAHDLTAAVDGRDREDGPWHRGTDVYVAAAQLAERLVADDPGRIEDGAVPESPDAPAGSGSEIPETDRHTGGENR